MTDRSAANQFPGVDPVAALANGSAIHCRDWQSPIGRLSCAPRPPPRRRATEKEVRCSVSSAPRRNFTLAGLFLLPLEEVVFGPLEDRP